MIPGTVPVVEEPVAINDKREPTLLYERSRTRQAVATAAAAAAATAAAAAAAAEINDLWRPLAMIS